MSSNQPNKKNIIHARISSKSQNDNFTSLLPVEVIHEIISFLDGESLLACNRTCLTLNTIVSEREDLFKYHCFKKWGITEFLDYPSWRALFVSKIRDTFLIVLSEQIDNFGTN
jgi:hypothetical protein